MRMLNRNATEIFCHLLEKLGREEEVTMITEGFMPLVFKLIGDNINSPAGTAKLYSLAHHQVGNGKVMCDPEMRFIVVDMRYILNRTEMISILSYMFRQDNTGKYEESIHIEANRLTTYHSSMQKDHAVFAGIWLENIKRQGFLE